MSFLRRLRPPRLSTLPRRPLTHLVAPRAPLRRHAYSLGSITSLPSESAVQAASGGNFFRSPRFLNAMVQYRNAMKWALIVNATVLTVQLSVHALLHKVEEDDRPTSGDWSFVARYWLRRARLWNAWNPWGDRQSESDVGWALRLALDTVQEEFAKEDGSTEEKIARKSPSWRGEYFRLYASLGGHHEREKDWDAARKDYETALAVPLEPGTFAMERVAAATRLARIAEWNDDPAAAQLALTRAVGYAYPPAITDEETGVCEIPLKLPSPDEKENTEALMSAVTELAVFLARHGEVSSALEMLSKVLMARRAAAGEVSQPRDHRASSSIGDPCKVASTMAGVGELMFALGKREEGVAWEEGAYETAAKLVEYRFACKDACLVAARNLVDMGKALERDADGMKGGWFWRGKKDKVLDEARSLVETYEEKRAAVEDVRAVRDSAVAARYRV